MDSTDRRHRRSRLMLTVGAVLVIVAATIAILSGVAHGSPKPSQSAAVAAQQPGGECTKAGATFKRHGKVYECVRKPWDDCLRWHHRKPADYQPPASWTRPAQRPCMTCTPTPSVPASPSSPPVSTAPPVTTPPAATTTPAASPTPPATTAPVVMPHPSDSATPAPEVPTLPVTGPPVLWIVSLGLLCVVVGALLRFYRRSVREADPHELSVR